MNNTVAFLSGKGGSGKTTIALSVSSMLSKCNIKILLLDCDLNTNGATYFYEEKLSQSKNILSFQDLICDDIDIDTITQINSNMFFIPSMTKFSEKNTLPSLFDSHAKLNFNRNMQKLLSNYDVILYDCQAGYSEVLELVLPLVDTNLIVMESDAISASSLRNLYLKIGHLLNDNHTYQIFNKVSSDEYKIYSKLSKETFFPNIETVLFNWEIRKAFALANVPNINHLTASYGSQINNICMILFKNNLHKKLESYKQILFKLNINEELDSLKKEHQELLKSTRLQNPKKINIYLGTTLTCTILILYSLIFQIYDIDYRFENLLSLTISALFLTILVISILLPSLNKSKELSLKRKNIDNLEKQLVDLENQHESLSFDIIKLD